MRYIPPRKKEPLKHCMNCGCELKRKVMNGRLEDFSVFLNRKFCTRDCYAVYKTIDFPSLQTAKNGIRYSKFKKKNCEKCGTTKYLVIHHKDRNVFNNLESNLQTLCASCHTKLHWEEGKKPKQAAKNKPCSICGIITRTHGGMCQKHYQRFRKYGNPLVTKPIGEGKLKQLTNPLD